MSIYVGNNYIARNVDKLYVGIDNVAKEVTKGYVGVNGVARLFYEKTIPDVPDIVKATGVLNNSQFQLCSSIATGVTVGIAPSNNGTASIRAANGVNDFVQPTKRPTGTYSSSVGVINTFNSDSYFFTVDWYGTGLGYDTTVLPSVSSNPTVTWDSVGTRDDDTSGYYKACDGSRTNLAYAIGVTNADGGNVSTTDSYCVVCTNISDASPTWRRVLLTKRATWNNIKFISNTTAVVLASNAVTYFNYFNNGVFSEYTFPSGIAEGFGLYNKLVTSSANPNINQVVAFALATTYCFVWNNTSTIPLQVSLPFTVSNVDSAGSFLLDGVNYYFLVKGGTSDIWLSIANTSGSSPSTWFKVSLPFVARNAGTTTATWNGTHIGLSTMEDTTSITWFRPKPVLGL